MDGSERCFEFENYFTSLNTTGKFILATAIFPPLMAFANGSPVLQPALVVLTLSIIVAGLPIALVRRTLIIDCGEKTVTRVVGIGPFAKRTLTEFGNLTWLRVLETNKPFKEFGLEVRAGGLATLVRNSISYVDLKMQAEEIAEVTGWSLVNEIDEIKLKAYSDPLYRFPITWNGEVVGWMSGRVFDMRFTYGKWHPAPKKATRAFLKSLDQKENANQTVYLGREPGVVHQSPAKGEIRVVLHAAGIRD